MTRRNLAFALLASTTLIPVAGRTQTLPSGGQVAAGQASIAGAGNAMTITQTSNRAVINWQDFSIAAGNRVDILQPGANAALLNRVTGSATSTIAGQLSANGQVYLVNPNGILISKSGSVNAAGFVASTLDLSDKAFMDGGEIVVTGNGGHVANHGTISIVKGGYAALIGGKVDNAGLIVAPLGKVTLASGMRATLDLEGDGFLQVALPATQTEDGVNMSGRIAAEGGSVLLTAGQARDAARAIVNLSGAIEAKGVEGRNGAVTLTGGDITLAGASIDVSGAAGGGTVRIGGDRQGGGTLVHADTLRVDAATTINADATVQGKGGDVVLWSDGRTGFAGAISARGAGSGDGGEAEVSSKGLLGFTGTADLRGARFGTLLLDPYNVRISSGADSNQTGFTATGNDSVINASTLTNALATADVTVSTGSSGSQAGNITVNAALSWGSSGTLTLNAAGTIALLNSITAPSGGLTLAAGGNINTLDTVSVARFTLNSGNWSQIGSTLPSFAASDFRLAGGTFVRAAAGNGTGGNPYQITDVYGLQGVDTLPTANVILANDINAHGTGSWNSGAGFVPIGHSQSFQGNFDGAGHVISDLTISNSAAAATGLIARLYANANVRRVGLTNANISGGPNTGGLVGSSFGNVSYSYVSGSVTGTTHVGGLVGINNGGSIVYAYSTASVSGTNTIGGAIGLNAGTIAHAYSTGAVANVSNSGGLIGGAEGGTLIAVFWDTQTSGKSSAAGYVSGSGSTAGSTGLTSAQARDRTNYAGLDFTNVWFQSGDMRPILRSEAAVPVNGVIPISNLHQLQLISTNLSGSYVLAADIDASGTAGSAGSADIYGAGGFIPIGLDPPGFSLGTFGGSLDGANHVISGLTINRSDLGNLGLIGSLGGSGRIANLGVVNATITGASDRIGVLAGASSGQISSSFSTGQVSGRQEIGGLVGEQGGGSITNSHSNAVASGNWSVGGLVGWKSGGTITGSFATGNVSAPSSAGGLLGFNSSGGLISNVYATGAVSGGQYAGGLIGQNYAAVSDAYATGDVSGGSYVGGLIGLSWYSAISNSYATGDVTATGDHVGGLVGESIQSGAAVSDSYATGSVTGKNYTGGLIGDAQGSIARSYATGVVTGTDQVGGLVGQNGAGISQSHASGSVTASTGSAGGLIGYNSGAISKTYATGNVSAGTDAGGLVGIMPSGGIDQSFSTGTPTGTRFVGGLVGQEQFDPMFGWPAPITASYWNKETSGRSEPVGNLVGDFGVVFATGLTTAQMQDGANYRTNFAGIDFTDTWAPPGGGYYPELFATSNVLAVNAGGTFVYGTTPTAIYKGLHTGDTLATLATISGVSSASAVGTYSVTASGALVSSTSGRNYRYVYIPGTATVTPRALTITTTAGNQSKTYGDALTLGTGSFTTGLGQLVNGDTVGAVTLASLGAPAAANVGTYAITGNATGTGLSNYTISYSNNGVLTVNPATLTYTANGATRTYGAANPTFTGTVTGFKNGQSLADLGGSLAWTSPAITSSNVGSYAINGSGLTSTNYVFSQAAANATSLSVTPAALVLTGSRTYNGGSDLTAAQLSFSGPVNGETVTVINGGMTTWSANAGSYAGSMAWAYSNDGSQIIANGSGPLALGSIVVAIQGGNADLHNYSLAPSVNLAITPAPVTITGSKTYDAGGNFTAGQLVLSGGVNGELLSLTAGSGAAGSANVGSYAGSTLSGLTLGVSGGPGLASNYQLPATGTLTINPATLTYTSDSASRTYGAANPGFGGTLTGFAAGETQATATSGTLAWTSAAGATSNVGSYAINGVGLTANNGNYVFAQAAGNATALAITPATLTYTADAVNRVYGAANPSLSGSVSGFVNGETLATATTGTLGWTSTAAATSSVGSYAVTGGGLAANNGNYSFVQAAGNSSALTINRATLTYTADAASRTYGAVNPAFGGTVTGFANGETLATATTGTLTWGSTANLLSNVGDYAITGGGLAATNYVFEQAAANATALTVTTAPLTVSGTRIYNGATTFTAGQMAVAGGVNGQVITLNAGSGATSSGNVGTYGGSALSNLDWAISGGSISNYQLPTTATLTITPRALTVTADALSRIYGDANPTSGTAAGDDLVAGDSITSVTLATPATVVSNVGSYNLTGSAATGTGLSNYTITYATRAGGLTITARPIQVLAGAATRTYGDANPTLGYTLGGSGLVNGDTLSGALATTAALTSSIGNYAITQGSLAAGTNYSLTFTGNTLTITPRALTVTANAASRVYGDANPIIGAATGDNLVNGDTISGVTLATSATAASNVGSYDLMGSGATGTGLTNYAINYATRTNGLTVTPRALTVTADAASRIYGNANPASGTATGDNLVNGDAITAVVLTTPATAASNVGSYDLIASAATGTGLTNYTINYATRTSGLSVTPRALTVTADAASRIYGNANPATGTATGDNLVNGDTLAGVTLTSSATASSNVGSYDLTGSAATGTGLTNYAISYATRANGLTVTPRALTVTADAASRIYGDANPASGTATGDNLVNGDTITSVALATPATVTSNVGGYDLTGSGATGTGLGNYTISYATRANGLSITPRPISVEADALSRIYGNPNPALTYAIHGSGLANGDTLSGTLATLAALTSGVGSYAITQGSLAASTNYSLSFTGANLSVTPRALTVTADALSRIYGDANPATGTAAGDNLVNGDTIISVALNTPATAAANVGNYDLTGSAATGTGLGNYTISYATRSNGLTITPRAITVAANPLSRVYGNANPGLTYTVGGLGLVNGDTLSGGLATAAAAASGIGNYAITQGNLGASTNYSLAFTGANLSVTPRALTVTADALSRVYGNANPVSGSATGDNLVNGDTITSVALATPATTISNVGSYDLTGSAAAGTGLGNYTISYATRANGLTVTARPITIAANALSRIYGDANPTLTYAVGGSGLVNGDTLSGLLATNAGVASGIGTYAIGQGSLAASANYSLSFIGADLSVTPRALTVTADALSRIYGNANPASGTASGDNLVNGDTITSVALTTPATVSSNVGSYDLTGSAATGTGLGNYTISYATRANGLTVTVRPITVAADPLSRIYGDANPGLTYTIGGSGLVNGDTLSGLLATAATPTSNVGTYAIGQGSLAASSNYSLAFTGANLSVTPRALTVTADALSRIYGNANPATGTATGDNLVNGDTVASVALATPATVTSNVGGYDLTGSGATGTGLANYTISYATRANGLTITPRPISVEADALSRIYGNPNPALTYAIHGSGLANGDTLSGTLATLAALTSGVGSYAITQGSLAASTNYSLSFTGANLSVTPRALTVTADALSRVYGDANPSLTYAVGGSGLVNGDTLSGALATTAALTSTIGNYAIGQGSLAATPNYSLAFTGATLAVTPRTLTVTADALSRIYGDANPVIGTATGDNLVNGDTIAAVALTTPATTLSNVGNYDLTGSAATGTGLSNYTISYATRAGGLTVSARPISVAANPLNRIYGDANPALTYTIGGSGLVNGDTLSGLLATTASVVSNVGDYAITQGNLAASSNYSLAFIGANLSVTPRAVIVAATPLSRIYGDANPALTYTVGGSGLMNGDRLSGLLATNAGITSGIGDYAITQGSLSGGANYNVAFTGANLLVTPRALTVTATPLSRTYGDTNPALTYAVGGLGLVNGDTLSGLLATDARVTSGVGSYAIGQGSLSGGANYSLAYSGANLVVTPRELTVTADRLSRIYGDANPALTYAVGGRGLVNGDTLSGLLATSGTTASGVGTYTITQGNLAANANYSLTFTGADLTVTPRALTVTADAISRTYGNANPASGSASGDNLVNGDTIREVALITPATAASNVGSYDLASAAATGTGLANYRITYATRTGGLTVTPRPLTITADTLSRRAGLPNPSLTYAIGGAGLVNGDLLSGSLATDATLQSVPGSYAISQGTLAASSNYRVSYVGNMLLVEIQPALPATALVGSALARDAFSMGNRPNPQGGVLVDADPASGILLETPEGPGEEICSKSNLCRAAAGQSFRAGSSGGR
ncbi:MBG domain-containing protein [Sphingomonas crusticola]|uniref:MBG domain-containing protein n=1 Tax=Sphingomonas crusticola TaxID=1697973 RepID=UPI0013C3729F|nr:MBG domain-containing protein [Sphingomonas crusticola]